MEEFDARRYWEDRLRANLDLRGVGYARLGTRYNRWMYRVRRRVFLRELRRLGAGPAWSVLDVGCGTGFYVDCWRELGVERITGVDLTRVAVEELRRRRPGLAFFELDIGAPLAEPWLARRFDAVSAVDVLFHVVDGDAYRRAFRNAHALLAPGGHFVFSEIHRSEVSAGQPHVALRTRQETDEVVRAAGFEIVRRTPMLYWMNPPAGGGRLLQGAWRGFSALVALHEWIGFVAGAALFPIELACVSLLRAGPTTTLVICRKPA